MKKVLCVLLAAMMLLTMAACGAKPEATDPTKAQTGATEATKPHKETTEATEATEKEADSYQKFMFPLMEVFCKVPEEFGRTTNGNIAVATGCDEYILTICNGFPGDYSGDLEGMLSHFAVDFESYTAVFLLADLNAEELKNVSCEKTTASGYDAVKFGSTVKNKSDKNYEIYGYAMIIDNAPVVFMGVLCSDDQAKADLEEMQDLIDLMAGSIYK